MARQTETTRTSSNWPKHSRRTQRLVVARPAGRNDIDSRRPADSANIRRIGPYETSYQVEFGYDTRRD